MDAATKGATAFAGVVEDPFVVVFGKPVADVEQRPQQQHAAVVLPPLLHVAAVVAGAAPLPLLQLQLVDVVAAVDGVFGSLLPGDSEYREKSEAEAVLAAVR